MLLKEHRTENIMDDSCSRERYTPGEDANSSQSINDKKKHTDDGSRALAQRTNSEPTTAEMIEERDKLLKEAVELHMKLMATTRVMRNLNERQYSSTSDQIL